VTDEAYGDPAEEAFGQLRTEVALLRRAVEGLAAAEERHEPVDYGPTLGKMASQLASLDKRIEALAQSPLLSLTPARVAGEIESATARARNEAQADWSRAQRELNNSVWELGQLIPHARSVRDQGRWLIGIGLSGIVLGVFLWIGFGGPVARALPDHWQLPERLAAATLRADRWSAGQQLMAKARPAAWRAMAKDLRFVEDNRAALDACRARASSTCKVSVRPSQTSR
jgi:hypothetical protein